MEKTAPVRAEIAILVSQYCGSRVGNSFAKLSEAEMLPVFLKHSFTMLKELAGEQKAREQLDGILRKYSITVPYD